MSFPAAGYHPFWHGFADPPLLRAGIIGPLTSSVLHGAAIPGRGARAVIVA
jgi:hypothetical protein